MEKMFELIDKAKVVSFDIFDTLLVRIYREPTDLFLHLEKSKHASGFYKARIEAEQSARKKAAMRNIHEVQLSEIYDEMPSALKKYQDDEIHMECTMCRADPYMKRVYEHCRQAGKRIYIASDMYLPSEIIERMLGKIGYSGWDKLLLSSQTLRPKATGEMYEDIVADSNVPPEDILHIGDHPFTDYEVAKKQGLQSYLYLPIKERNGRIYNDKFFSTLDQYVSLSPIASILQGLTSLRDVERTDEGYWKNFGYKYAGILALGYVKWIKRQLDEQGIKHAYFMLRDGYIFHRVFEMLYPDFCTDEIYGSRSMYMLPGMASYKDIQMHITGMHLQGLTYRRCYERLDIDDPKLLEDYIDEFPDQNESVAKDNGTKKVDQFFQKHEKEIAQAGKKRRETILDYFQSIGLFDEKCAIVDLGWKGSMLKSIEKICSLEGKKPELYGYYIGTHSFDPEGIRAYGYALNNGEPDDKYPVKSLLDYGFVIAVLELLYSAPHPSILGVRKEESAFHPIYQNTCAEEQRRIDISGMVLRGVLDFVRDFEEVERKYPLTITPDDALIPMEYLSCHISTYDRKKIEEVNVFPGVGNDLASYPITKAGHIRFGITFPWPGSTNAETEAVLRIKRAAQECGYECVPIDNYGHQLDDELKKIVSDRVYDDFDFVITTHYECHKSLDTFFYHALWNPPEYPLNGDYYSWVSKNYLMSDDYLRYDKGSMTNHLKSMLINCPRSIDDASALMTTFPESAVLQPRLEDPKIFYCGTNWDKMVTGTTRHEGLLKLLDNSGVLKIYGPDFVEGWGGVWPWKGYKCYQHPIPFDGFSILEELNKCGICLVVSSEVHRRAGAVTNRAFEACAAGAVIISDDNYLMKEMFGDAALFINYNRDDPAEAYRQIMGKYQWIVDHPEDALEMAKRSQKIFLEKYTLNTFLQGIVKHHARRVHVIENDLYARTDEASVMVCYVCGTQKKEEAEEKLSAVFSNVQNQYYRNILPVIVVDQSIADFARAFAGRVCPRAVIVSMSLNYPSGTRKLTDGQAIASVRMLYEHDYFMLTNADERWFQDHVTTLVRTIEDNHASVAYSGELFVDCNGYRQVHKYDVLHSEDLFDFDLGSELAFREARPYPGCFMFSNISHQYVPDYLFDCLDGSEYIAYLHLLLLKHKLKASFTRRMTFLFPDIRKDVHHTVINQEQERRFILDLARYDMDISHVPARLSEQQVDSAPEKKKVLDMLELLPVKPYLKMRYYRIRLRKTGRESPKGRKLVEKYNAAKEAYLKNMGF